jgi:hypothetical protein
MARPKSWTKISNDKCAYHRRDAVARFTLHRLHPGNFTVIGDDLQKDRGNHEAVKELETLTDLHGCFHPNVGGL